MLDAPGCDPILRRETHDCDDLYDHSSTARAADRGRGWDVPVFDNASIYRGQTTMARENCAAATPLPLAVVDATP